MKQRTFSLVFLLGILTIHALAQRASTLPTDPLTLQEVGNQFGISRERVRQLEERLKKQLIPHLAPFADRPMQSARAA